MIRSLSDIQQRTAGQPDEAITKAPLGKPGSKVYFFESKYRPKTLFHVDKTRFLIIFFSGHAFEKWRFQFHNDLLDKHAEDLVSVQKFWQQIW